MFNSKCTGMVLTIRVILLVSYKKQELLNLHGHPVHPQGLTVIFSHHQVCVEKKKGGHFLGPKVKVEFRHPFSLRKRFNLWSSHKINANIDRFLLIILFVFTLYLDPTIAGVPCFVCLHSVSWSYYCQCPLFCLSSLSIFSLLLPVSLVLFVFTLYL